MTTYLSLALISFLAATIIPLSSELALASLLSTNEHNSFILIAILLPRHAGAVTLVTSFSAMEVEF